MVNPVFRIVHTGRGMGGFLAPPGHPDHFYEVRGYWPRPGRASVGISGRHEADSYSSISSVITNEHGEYPDGIVAAARRIMDAAELVCSEAWVRQVYGYFRHSYSPDGADRNVSNAVSTSKLVCACGEESWNRRGMQHHVNQVLKTALGVRKRWTRKRETAPPGPHYLVTRQLPPKHHLGYLMVRKYFPDHQPRLDLIADPGNGYGSHACRKCGRTVQYESRFDAMCEVQTSPWKWTPDCPEGGQHA